MSYSYDEWPTPDIDYGPPIYAPNMPTTKEHNMIISQEQYKAIENKLFTAYGDEGAQPDGLFALTINLLGIEVDDRQEYQEPWYYGLEKYM